jgi:trimethylamine---corrinoid protein Co-methyltransferase
VDKTIADCYQMAVMLTGTRKPIVFVNYDYAGCPECVEMAEIVAGGAAALRARPFIAAYINVTTGLRHNEEALRKLIFMAEKGLPALYICSGLGGVTAPVTIAGGMALVNAGTLAGLVVAQLTREGTPFIAPGFGGETVDMRTLQFAYAVPDYKGTAESMAHFYSLPTFTTAGVTDSKAVDQQAAAEAALTLMVDSLAGGHIVHDLGYMEMGLSGSLAQLVICDEIVSWIKGLVGPIEVSDETLAFDLINEVGPDGEFLGCDHTLRHFRERWYPRLFDRANFDTWSAKGSPTLAQRAAERVDRLLASHEPRPLPADVASAVQAVVARVAERAGS